MFSSILSLITRNLGIKILALLMAGMVYAHVFTEEEQEWDLQAPLRVSSLPSNLVFESPPPNEVTLKLRGRGKQLLKLRVDPPQVLLDLRGAGPGSVQRFLSPTDVTLPLGAEVVVSQIVDPQVVTLAVDTLVTRAVPVRIPLLGSAPEGLQLVGPIRCIPDRVMASGPSKLLDRLEVTADPFHLEKLPLLDEVRLSIRPSIEGISLSPTEVGVTGAVIILGERTLPPLRVVVEGAMAGVLRSIEPESVRVTLAGPLSSLDSLSVQDVFVRLNASALPPGRHLLTPEVRLLRPGFEVSTVHPLRFMVEIDEP